MSLIEETGAGLNGLDQLRALMSSGREPGILASLDFNLIEVDVGKKVFAGDQVAPRHACRRPIVADLGRTLELA